ncbi:unnamed protein product [Sphenostylis stenocarpa]|uniref:Uncharacterized protein n=1 Tax=Sphenostylis stenocarpa TaxID=92480 RepID=A0AA86SSS3_9FABA|nr:unnamed protein product [Sphenostylis stenocarpa]
MAKRFPLVLSNKNLLKRLLSTTPIPPIVSINGLCIPNANANALCTYHEKIDYAGGDSIVGAAEGAVKSTEVLENVGERAKDTALDAAKKSAELETESTMAAADTNVLDTAEYRCSEDLRGHLGDGHDSYT